MIRRCSRCGEDFTARQAEDRHCTRCHREVRDLVASDATRRQPRFTRAKVLDAA